VTQLTIEASNCLWNLTVASSGSRAHAIADDTNMRLGGKLPPWLILLALLLGGLVLIVLSHVWETTWYVKIAAEIGIALLVAGILGFTIDRWLKAELRTDAFLAAIGHILPQEFRAEVSRIISYALICERHTFAGQLCRD
jgi:hypothetical protein